MTSNPTKPTAGQRKKGRPEGSGRGLSAVQRAVESRLSRQLSGGKRLEVVLSQEAYLALRILKHRMGAATYKDVVEALLLADGQPDAKAELEISSDRAVGPLPGVTRGYTLSEVRKRAA